MTTSARRHNVSSTGSCGTDMGTSGSHRTTPTAALSQPPTWPSETTDSDDGHPFSADDHGHARPPRTSGAHLLVTTTDITTDTTDTTDHGHHRGGYTPVVVRSRPGPAKHGITWAARLGPV